MKRRKNSALLLAARAAAGRVARRFSSRAAAFGKKAVKRAGKRAALYGIERTSTALEDRVRRWNPGRANPCADVSWPPHKPYQLVRRVPVVIPRMNPDIAWVKSKKDVWTSIPKRYKVVKLQRGWKAWCWDEKEAAWRTVPGTEDGGTVRALKAACAAMETPRTKKNPKDTKSLRFFVVYELNAPPFVRPIWRGYAKNAHNAQVKAENATGRTAGIAREVKGSV